MAHATSGSPARSHGKPYFRLEPISFPAIEGWAEDDFAAAMAAFRQSAMRMRMRPYSTKPIGLDALDLAHAAGNALALSDREAGDNAACRTFFESNFDPMRLRAGGQATDAFDGFVTGYFEPEIDAAKEASADFPVPVLRRPTDLVEIDDQTRPPNLAPHLFFARRLADGLGEYPDRPAIEQGALCGMGLELYWCRSRIDLFFVQIQGSARLRLPDRTTRRISYDGKTGHPFTAIGRLLIDRGDIAPETVSMQTIRAWLEKNPGRADALMWENRSYIFFREVDHPAPELGPVAAAGVPLTPRRSLAVDHRLHTFATPVFVSTRDSLPGEARPFRQLMVAQDTGSAIVGPVRGDLFMGSGDEAGLAAGAIRHAASFVLLKPKPRPG